MDFRQQHGPYALVVGASTTIGEQFARQLAARGLGLVLVARRRELLDGIAHDVRREHGVDVRVIASDLLAEDAFDRLIDATRDLEIGLLVVNANLHKVGAFDAMDRATKLRMLRMNVELPVLLTDHFGHAMVARGRGGVIFVNVLNSLSPIEIDGVFQGTKAFLRLFAESLWIEYRRRGVQVATVLVNGIEGSESYEKKLSSGSREFARVVGGSLPPSKIVQEALRQYDRGRWICIPDVAVPVNRLAVVAFETFRGFGGAGAARLSSTLLGMLLDGPEVAEEPRAR